MMAHFPAAPGVDVEMVARGRLFDASASYRMPDGSLRTPDASWMPEARWTCVDGFPTDFTTVFDAGE